MTLFIKRFKRVMKKDGYFKKDKGRSRSRGSPTSHALGVGKLVTLLPIAQTQRTRTRMRRSIARARRSIREWDSKVGHK
jgi:hypothetical protein